MIHGMPFPALTATTIDVLRSILPSLFEDTRCRDISGTHYLGNEIRDLLRNLDGGSDKFEPVRFTAPNKIRSEGIIFSRTENRDADGAVIWDLVLIHEIQDITAFRLRSFSRKRHCPFVEAYYPSVITLHGLNDGIPYNHHFFEYGALTCYSEDYPRGRYRRIPETDPATNLLLAFSQLSRDTD